MFLALHLASFTLGRSILLWKSLCTASLIVAAVSLSVLCLRFRENYFAIERSKARCITLWSSSFSKPKCKRRRFRVSVQSNRDSDFVPHLAQWSIWKEKVCDNIWPRFSWRVSLDLSRLISMCTEDHGKIQLCCWYLYWTVDVFLIKTYLEKLPNKLQNLSNPYPDLVAKFCLKNQSQGSDHQQHHIRQCSIRRTAEPQLLLRII